jgi:hypothetical protein
LGSWRTTVGRKGRQSSHAYASAGRRQFVNLNGDLCCQYAEVGPADALRHAVVWRRRFRTRGEAIYRVEACQEHGGELTHPTRIR